MVIVTGRNKTVIVNGHYNKYYDLSLKSQYERSLKNGHCDRKLQNSHYNRSLQDNNYDQITR